MLADTIREIPLLADFVNCPIDMQERILKQVSDIHLEPGEVLFNEGEMAAGLYVLIEGILQIVKTIGGQPVVLSDEQPGSFVGEISLFTGVPHTASTRASVPSRVLRFNAVLFDDMRANPAMGVLLTTMMQRLRSTEATVQQHEKLSALGRLSAGLAHELNNPASASLRATKQLLSTVEMLQGLALQIHTLHLNTEQVMYLSDFGGTLLTYARKPCILDPLEQSDREDQVATWIDNQGIEDGWKLAPMLVAGGLDPEQLDALREKLGETAFEDALHWLEGILTLASLLRTIEQSNNRISELVQSVKDYTYMDQSPVQEVDIHDGIESTLVILGHKLRDFTVVRQYDRSLPKLTVYGSQLNQVWTNLIDNAIDAMTDAGQTSGRIEIRTSPDNECIKVEITDNGPGIPQEVQSRIFEPFFTTKGVGKGTGLGLDISRRIVVQQHHGHISVTSKPGETRFTIYLPTNVTEQAG